MLAERRHRVLLLLLVLACAALQCTQASAPPSALSSTAAAAGQRANEAATDTSEEQQQQQQPQAEADDISDDADGADDSADEDSSWGAIGVPFIAAGAVLETAGNNVIEVLEDPSVLDIHGIEVRGGGKGVQLHSCDPSACKQQTAAYTEQSSSSSRW
jgi:hypothetical protein